jgi:hypothetical protein
VTSHENSERDKILASLPYFDILHQNGRVFSSTRRPPLSRRRYRMHWFLSEAVWTPSATECGQKEFYKDPNGNRTWNLPFCGVVSQPTTAQLLPSGANGIGGWAILRTDLKVANYVFFPHTWSNATLWRLELGSEWTHTLLTPALEGFE